MNTYDLGRDDTGTPKTNYDFNTFKAYVDKLRSDVGIHCKIKEYKLSKYGDSFE